MRMYGSMWAMLAGLTACAAAGPEGTETPGASNTRQQAVPESALPADRRAEHVYRGDLDGDGDGDALVVTAPATGNEDRARGVVLLVHEGDDSWRIAARNDRAVPCSSCGGAMGDPLAGVDIVPGGFVLRFGGGSRELWSVAYRFRHESARARWVLDAVDRRVLDRATGEAKQAHAGPADTRQLDFAEFDPDDEALAPID